MQTNDHPLDSIPAFVLGALDIDEALLVNAHITMCHDCRAEAAAFQAVLSALPYAAAPGQPPAHVKQQLRARIAAATPAARALTPGRATPRWMQAATGGALALSLAFGMMFYDTNSRVALLNSELNTSKQSIMAMNQQLIQSQQTLAQLNQQHLNDQTAIAQINDKRAQDAQAIEQMQDQIAHAQRITMFIAAPQTLPRLLAGADRRARATMYMQPNNRQAVLVVADMPRAAPGTIYQFWLAKPGVQVASVTFDVSDDGLAVLQINAPAPVNQFDQVMVTIEQAGGATLPSDKIVLSGTLNTARPASAPRADQVWAGPGTGSQFG
jgi:Anti-sigma-K factor rskA/Putative zinc-finger